MKQRCYCLTAHHQPLERREEDVPEPDGGEVLVRILAAGVCHSDIHIWEGEYDLGSGRKLVLRDRGVSLPLVMGHEIAGEVAALGPDAEGLQIGDRVLVHPWLGCGECRTCARGQENLCLRPASIGVYRAGGYAEYVLVPRSAYCIDIGALDPAEAAPLACSGVTTYSALRKFGAVIEDEPVVIMGAGLDSLGALSAIDGSAPDAAKQIIAATGGGARMVLDLVGSTSTVNLAIASATRGTEIVVVGLYGGELTVAVPFFPLRPLAIRGSYVGNLAELHELVRLAVNGKLALVKVTRRPLDEVPEVLAQLKAGKIFGRAVLVP